MSKTLYRLNLDQLEDSIAQLSIQDQLTLIGRVSERLAKLPITLPPPTPEEEETARQQRVREIDEMFARLDAIPELSESYPDADEEELRELRRERDQQIEKAVSGQYE